jgi:hypothetical protein
LATADGVKVFVYRWLPPGPCKGAVQIAHGLAEQSANAKAGNRSQTAGRSGKSVIQASGTGLR